MKKKTKTGKEKRNSIVDRMKKRIETAADNSNKKFRFISNEKRRIRFLTELEDAVLVKYHNVWGEDGFLFPCPKYFGYEECPLCSGDHEYGNKMKTREKYAISFFDYETRETKFLDEAANNFSPIPDLVAYFEEYGTILDRDYTIKRTGENQQTSYTVMAADESIFKGRKKYKAMTEEEIFEHLKKINIAQIEKVLGYTAEEEELEEDEEIEEEIEEDEEENYEEEEEEEEIKPKKKVKKKRKW